MSKTRSEMIENLRENCFAGDFLDKFLVPVLRRMDTDLTAQAEQIKALTPEQIAEEMGPIAEVEIANESIPYPHLVRIADLSKIPPGTKLYASSRKQQAERDELEKIAEMVSGYLNVPTPGGVPAEPRLSDAVHAAISDAFQRGYNQSQQPTPDAIREARIEELQKLEREYLDLRNIRTMQEIIRSHLVELRAEQGGKENTNA